MNPMWATTQQIPPFGAPPLITTTGATFSPSIGLVANSPATVTWLVNSVPVATGTNPTINFGTAATRTVQMNVTVGAVPAYNQVYSVNFGFDSTLDPGIYSIGPSYNYPPQQVAGMQYVNTLTGLSIFAAMQTNLTGTMDFTGLTALQFIECYGSLINGVVLTGCTALIRLNVEQTNTSVLDLNPVAGNLYDLRAAGQRGGSLTFTTLSAPLTHLYHFCTMSVSAPYHVINKPPPSQLPVVQQYWTWGDGFTGPFTFDSSAIYDVESFNNNYTSADVTGQFPPGRNGRLNLGLNLITSVNLTGCSGLTNIDLNSNSLDQPNVDAILATVDGWGTSGGFLDLSLNTAPSAAGVASASNLTGRGWTVYVDASTPVIPVPPPYYRIFPLVAGPPASASPQPAGLVNGIAFDVVGQAIALFGYLYWRADATQSASASFALWQITSNSTGIFLGAATTTSTSSMVAGQWNYVALPTPFALTSGVTYMAAVGFTGTFPFNTGVFGGGDRYSAGITNGPLTAFSAPSGTNPTPFGNPQCSYTTTGGADPTAQFPNQAFNDENVYVDVVVSPNEVVGLIGAGAVSASYALIIPATALLTGAGSVTAETGSKASLTGAGTLSASGLSTDTYRLFSTNGPSSSQNSSTLTVGISFKVTASGLNLDGYSFWRADTTQSASCSFALWQVTGNTSGTYLGSSTNVSTTSMVAGQWNDVMLPSKFPLTAGTPYMAVVGFTGTHPLATGQFGAGDPYAGGIISGPLVAFSAESGTNPGPFNSPQCMYQFPDTDPTTGYPNSEFLDLNVYLDVIVGP
jgi:hypothetical protein